MINKMTLGPFLCILALATWSSHIACDDQESRGSDGDTDGDSDSDSDSDTDSDTDSDSDADECADYRASYPEGPYGTATGSILADFPGMQDGQGNLHNLEEFFLDTSIVAVVIANAFDS
jgi:hypothetical protein